MDGYGCFVVIDFIGGHGSRLILVQSNVFPYYKYKLTIISTKLNQNLSFPL